MSTPPVTREKAPRQRLFYLDLVRALAAILIVVTHFNNPYLMQGHYVLAIEPFGIYVGGLGVSLFLIISGAALMVTYGDRVDLKRFYWKRFKGIYPMFWLAWILATSYFIIDRQGVPINGAPSRSFIFTFLGIDGLAANFQFHTMYLLGEWFLGFIIIFYVVFPLLRWGVAHHPVVTAVVILVVWAATLYYFHTPRPFPSSVILTTRLPELAFGMYFARYMKKAPLWVILPAVGILVVSSMRPQFNEDIATTFVGIASFLIIVAIARFVDIQPVRAFVGIIAKYSYAIFLVHHVVILKVFEGVDATNFYPVQVYGFFGGTCILIFGIAVGLHRLNDVVVQFVTDAFAGLRIRK